MGLGQRMKMKVERGSPWKTPQDIEKGEEDQNEVVTVAESC